MATILFVEDEKGLADSVTTELKLENMEVINAFDGQEALDLYRQYQEKIDLILLDWMLPKVDGFSVLRRVRKTSQVPVIMLTARTYIGDKIAGLTGGADDYITKPFEMEELIARIEVALRHGKEAKRAGSSSSASKIQVGDLTIDLTAKQAVRDHQIIALTPREFALLAAMAKHHDQPCSHNQLLDAVWGTAFEGEPNILDVYIRQLCHKIDNGDGKLKLIHTIRGTGYMLSANVAND